MQRNRISLDLLQDDIENESEIDLTKNESMNASDLIIIKRDGREEPYNIKKMKKVVMWACDGNKYHADDLLSSTEIKLYPKIKISDVYDELIKTAAAKISLIYPEWEYIAARLYLLKLYKETWHIGNGEYPEYRLVISKGEQYGTYDYDVTSSYSEEEIAMLNDAIDPTRDLLFTYKGLTIMADKYCMNYTKTRKLELPQHVYMRVALFNHWKEPANRIEKVIKTYNRLSTHQFTNATPISVNSLMKNAQLSSCVLSDMTDDTIGIMDGTKNLAVYSKYRGGTALDVSKLRAKGSYIKGNQGYSSGPVPFIKIVESTLKAFNQGSSRPGACCVHFQWWHYDFFDMIVLKSNGGTEENRARGLKYSVKINDLLLKRWINDEDITLFDPMDVPNLIGKYGKEFDTIYEHYETKTTVRKKTVSARELMFSLMKERTETGNIYIFHEENVNNGSMLNRYINTSNLCVAGDTIINIKVDGMLMNIEIKDLGAIMEMYDSVQIISHDLNSNEKIYSEILDYAMTNDQAEVIKITDIKTGRTLECTEDHLVYTENRGYIKAGCLEEDDVLIIV